MLLSVYQTPSGKNVVIALEWLALDSSRYKIDYVGKFVGTLIYILNHETAVKRKKATKRNAKIRI